MKIRDEELLARLRALGSKARGGAPPTTPAVPSVAGAEDAVSLLGLPEQELTPSVRAALRHLIEEVDELGAALKRSVRNRTRTSVERLLKLQHSPAQDPRTA